MGPKRQGEKRAKKESPVKGRDKCAHCKSDLDDQSNAIECTDCEKWLCTNCLKMPSHEYEIIKKMSETVAFDWLCPLCKHKPSRSSPGDLVELMKATLAEFKNELKDEVNDALMNFKDNLKTELTSNIRGLQDRVSELEDKISEKCSVIEVENIVASSLDSRFENIEEHVRGLVRSEQDRHERRLSIVAYGVPQQHNDSNFIKSYLESDFGLKVGNIFDTKRLVKPGAPQTSRPHPLLFSVTSVAIKRQIIKKSYEKRGTIQFYGDASKEDRIKRSKLVEELRERLAKGEKGLVIRNSKIVTKNLGVPPATGGLPSAAHMEH